MGKSINQTCDYCGKICIEADKQKETLNGFMVEIGYSTCGWGSRKDYVSKQSVEICNNCFNAVSHIAKELSTTINSLKK